MVQGIVIGKRIPVGAAITSTATAIAHFYPEEATAIMAASVPFTMLVQIIVANVYGVTRADDPQE